MLFWGFNSLVSQSCFRHNGLIQDYFDLCSCLANSVTAAASYMYIIMMKTSCMHSVIVSCTCRDTDKLTFNLRVSIKPTGSEQVTPLYVVGLWASSATSCPMLAKWPRKRIRNFYQLHTLTLEIINTLAPCQRERITRRHIYHWLYSDTYNLEELSNVV